MNFIIFDLEWNNAYNYKLKRGMNEIIEIGAVKLDENLKVIDTLNQNYQKNSAQDSKT